MGSTAAHTATTAPTAPRIGDNVQEERAVLPEDAATLEDRPPVDVFRLSDGGRGLVTRIACLFGADGEDLAGRKDVFDGWVNAVRELLGSLLLSPGSLET